MASEGIGRRLEVGDKVRVKLDTLTPGTIGFTGVVTRYDEDPPKAVVLYDEQKGIGLYYPSELEYIDTPLGPADPSSYSVEDQLIAVFSGGASIDDIVTEESEDDNVNHPSHYTSHPSGIECIDITEHYDFCVGNAIKYLWRAGLKQDADKTDIEKEIEDLNKAKWYINRKINRLLKTKEK